MTSDELDRAVLGKLAAEGLTLDSDYKDIKFCLLDCVRSDLCMKTVDKLLRCKRELALNQTTLDL